MDIQRNAHCVVENAPSLWYSTQKRALTAYDLIAQPSKRSKLKTPWTCKQTCKVDIQTARPYGRNTLPQRLQVGMFILQQESHAYSFLHAQYGFFHAVGARLPPRSNAKGVKISRSRCILEQDVAGQAKALDVPKARTDAARLFRNPQYASPSLF